MILLVLNLAQPAPAAVRGTEVRYVGGSVLSVPDDTEGKVVMSENGVLTFISKKGQFEIPFDSITSLEYGQKAGRRLGATIALGITTLGLAALPILLSKKRKHFVSIGYKDDRGRPQGVVLEVAKGMTKSFLMKVEAVAGVECEYESEEARKHVHG